MILTDRPLGPAMKVVSGDTTDGKNKTKSVKFAVKECTILAYFPMRSEMEPYEQDEIWISEEERVNQKTRSTDYGKELREKYPALVKGLECIYQWAEIVAQEEKENATKRLPQKHDFLDKWASLSSDRRGLEKRVLSKTYQKRRMQSVEGSRRCVLALQELYNKTGAAADGNSQAVEVMRKQYEELSRPFKVVAMTMALTDEAVAKKYHMKKASSTGSLRSLMSRADSEISLGGGSVHGLGKTRRSKRSAGTSSSLRSLMSRADSEISLGGGSVHGLGKTQRSKRSAGTSSPKKNRRSLSPKRSSSSSKKQIKNETLDLTIVVPPAC